MGELLKEVPLCPLNATADEFKTLVTERHAWITKLLADIIDDDHKHGLLREAKNLTAILDDDDLLATKIEKYNAVCSTHNQRVADAVGALNVFKDIFGAAIAASIAGLIKDKTGFEIDTSKLPL